MVENAFPPSPVVLTGIQVGSDLGKVTQLPCAGIVVPGRCAANSERAVGRVPLWPKWRISPEKRWR